MSGRVFGEIPGYPEGSRFGTRSELSEAGLHRPRVAGISGSEKEGADSIVLSGSNEDGEDRGDEIVYTGHGGRDVQTGRQIADQNFRGGNRALVLSSLNGLPVRVIRKGGAASHYPAGGYRYDGLYLVDDYWQEKGRSGFLICATGSSSFPALRAEQTVSEERGAYSAAPRQASTTTRIVRDTEQAWRIKALYDHECQMCGIRLVGLAGPYAEAAHIRPLGAPHDGPDVSENILCLCPNHHMLFDHGGVTVGANLTLIGAVGRLTVHPKHHIGAEYLRYRWEHHGAAPCSNR